MYPSMMKKEIGEARTNCIDRNKIIVANLASRRVTQPEGISEDLPAEFLKVILSKFVSLRT